MIPLEKWEENEQKKEYLKSYQYAKRREKRIEEEIYRLRMDKMFPSLVYDDMPHGTAQKDLSDYAALLDEQIRELKEERLERVRIYTDIEKRIKGMEKDTEREVLRLKYLTGMKWEEVAVEMGYSWKHIHRIHSSALNNLRMT